MGHASGIRLRFLDPLMKDSDDVSNLITVLRKIEKCCLAINKGINLADILNDSKNYQSLKRIFGEDEIEIGLQLILKISLSEYLAYCFTVSQEIQGGTHFDRIRESFGCWDQFDIVLCFWLPNAQMIVAYLSDYQGRVEMYMFRSRKEQVLVDADSIWGAEIRNGKRLFPIFMEQNHPTTL